MIAERVKGAAFKNAVAKVPDSLLKTSLCDLERTFVPTNTEIELKSRFWSIVVRSGSVEKLDPKEIYRNVCTYTHWYNGILQSSLKLCWLLKPSEQIKELALVELNDWIHSAKQILSLEETADNGGINTSIVRSKIRVFEIILRMKEFS